METYLENVKTKTGKTPDDFRVLAEAKGLTKHGEIVNWLKEDFDLGHGHANAVAHVILHADDPKESDDQGIAKHFAGIKSVWREPYDALLEKLKEFGDDVRVAPTKTYLSLLRNDKKFGIVQVSAKRLDIGIKLAGTAAKRRFEQAGAWNAMVTHRVKIDSPEELDAEVLTWLRQAYDKAE
jgi:predicted transport protein